jgi:hypothetical protein
MKGSSAPSPIESAVKKHKAWKCNLTTKQLISVMCRYRYRKAVEFVIPHLCKRTKNRMQKGVA